MYVRVLTFFSLSTPRRGQQQKHALPKDTLSPETEEAARIGEAGEAAEAGEAGEANARLERANIAHAAAAAAVAAQRRDLPPVFDTRSDSVASSLSAVSESSDDASPSPGIRPTVDGGEHRAARLARCERRNPNPNSYPSTQPQPGVVRSQVH